MQFHHLRVTFTKRKRTPQRQKSWHQSDIASGSLGATTHSTQVTDCRPVLLRTVLSFGRLCPVLSTAFVLLLLSFCWSTPLPGRVHPSSLRSPESLRANKGKNDFHLRRPADDTTHARRDHDLKTVARLHRTIFVSFLFFLSYRLWPRSCRPTMLFISRLDLDIHIPRPRLIPR